MLLESEAEKVRSFIHTAMSHVRSFGEEINEAMRKIGSTIQNMEGGYTVVHNSDSSSSAQQV